MTDTIAPCANCRRVQPDVPLDPAGWCPGCRRSVVRRATRVARLVAIVATLAIGLLIAVVFRASTVHPVVWLLVLGALYAIVHRLSRRVVFELVRSHGIQPTGEG